MSSSYFSNGFTDSRSSFNKNEKRDRDEEKPTFCRLFIVCAKQHTTEDLREAFGSYGTIEDIYVVKDKITKENRGIAYIQFSKMSEACLAIENLNGKKISDEDRSGLKVIMAQPRTATYANVNLDDEGMLTRIFILIPKGMEEAEIKDSFAEFGDVEYVNVVKDRNTGEKKGFGYIKFNRAYEAAKALEESDKNFKAIMAEPKPPRKKRELSNGHDSGAGSPMDLGFSFGRIGDTSNTVQQMPVGFDERLPAGAIGNRLQVACAKQVTNDQLARLFDLIPGMELCDLKKNFSTGESKGLAIIVYNSIGSATYAKEKLNGFEYPPGYKLSVRYAPDGQIDFTSNVGDISTGVPLLSSSSPGAGATYCSVELPDPQPIVKTDEVAERLFIVCAPAPPPQSALVDVFSRFGDLIDVYTLKNKNFGYAKFSSSEGAAKAMEVLHGAEICGCKLKVLTAEPPKDPESSRKRPRT